MTASTAGGTVRQLAATGGATLALVLVGVYVAGFLVLWFPAALRVQRFIYAQPPDERPDTFFRWIFVLGAGVAWPVTLPLYLTAVVLRLRPAGRGLVLAGGGLVAVALVGVVLSQQ